MVEIKYIIDLWPILLSIVFVIIWCIRLESKVMYLEKDHEAHKSLVLEREKMTLAKLDDLQKTLNLVLQAIGELKGKISHD